MGIKKHAKKAHIPPVNGASGMALVKQEDVRYAIA